MAFASLPVGGLARFLRAGAGVPDGFAVAAGKTDPRACPPDLLDRFRASCAALLHRGRIAVRSSALGGGVMCHAAVVARELGIPAVFGVERATELFGAGQKIVVDGSTRIVRRLDEPDAV